MNKPIYDHVFGPVGGWADPASFPPEESWFLEEARKRITQPLERSNRAFAQDSIDAVFRFDYVESKMVNAFAIREGPNCLIGITREAAIRIRSVITGDEEMRQWAHSARNQAASKLAELPFGQNIGPRLMSKFPLEKRPKRPGDEIALQAVEFVAMHEAAHLGFEHCRYLESLGFAPCMAEWGPGAGPLDIARGLEVHADLRACEFAVSACGASTASGVLEYIRNLLTGIVTLFSIFEVLSIWEPSFGPRYHPSPEARILIAEMGVAEFAKSRYKSLSKEISETTSNVVHRVTQHRANLGIGFKRLTNFTEDLQKEVRQALEQQAEVVKLLDAFAATLYKRNTP